jgi:hypothetical protein
MCDEVVLVVSLTANRDVGMRDVKQNPIRVADQIVSIFVVPEWPVVVFDQSIRVIEAKAATSKGTL